MTQNSSQDGETSWRELAVELVNEQDPSKLVKLAQELNQALENDRVASKNGNAQANKPDAKIEFH